MGPTDATQAEARLQRRVTLAAVGGLLAIVSSGVALVFSLWPGLRPDPRTDRSADVSVFAVDRGVSVDSWLHRVLPDPEAYTAKRAAWLKQGVILSTKGEVAYVVSTVKGFKRRSTTVDYSIYDAKTDTRLPAAPLSDVVGSKRKLDAPTDQAVVELWLPPLLGSRRRFFVRVQVRDSDGNVLAVADSRPFRGLAAR